MKYRIALGLFILVPGQVNRIFLTWWFSVQFKSFNVSIGYDNVCKQSLHMENDLK